MLDAQTLTHGLNDSPIGMLSWILQRWKKWSDQRVLFEESFPKDEILTNATIYWVNQAIGSSIRAYKNANRYLWQPSDNRTPAIEAPAGFTFLTGELAEELLKVGGIEFQLKPDGGEYINIPFTPETTPTPEEEWVYRLGKLG